MQDLKDSGKSFFTINVYLRAIAACHVVFRGADDGRSLPVTRITVPNWGLSMALETLFQQPFEPLLEYFLKLLSFETAVLLAMTPAKHVSDLHAHSACFLCTNFSLSRDMIFLRPNLAFVHKCFPACT